MANLIATPRFWKKKLLLLKLETTYNVDTVATGAANWFEARNVTLTPMDVEKVSPDIVMAWMGNSGDIITAKWSKLSFDLAVAPSGTAGVAPKWGPALMACGFAETTTAGTSVLYRLVSTAFSSICGYIYIDGVKHKLRGMRGEVKCKMAAKGLPLFSISYDSVYLAPVEEDSPAVVKTGWMQEEAVNSAQTGPCVIAGQALSFSSLDWSLGNKISRVDLPGPQQEISIDDRAPQASITVLAPALSVFNPFTLVESCATVALASTHGSAAGKKLKTDMNVRVTNADYDKIEGMLAYKLTLQPLPVNGNDEIVLTCL